MTPRTFCYVPFSKESASFLQLRLSVLGNGFFSVAMLVTFPQQENKDVESTLTEASTFLSNLATSQRLCSNNCYAEFVYPNYCADRVLPFLAASSANLPSFDEMMALNRPMGENLHSVMLAVLPYTRHTLEQMAYTVAFSNFTSTQESCCARNVTPNCNRATSTTANIPILENIIGSIASAIGGSTTTNPAGELNVSSVLQSFPAIVSTVINSANNNRESKSSLNTVTPVVAKPSAQNRATPVQSTSNKSSSETPVDIQLPANMQALFANMMPLFSNMVSGQGVQEENTTKSSTS